MLWQGRKECWGEDLSVARWNRGGIHTPTMEPSSVRGWSVFEKSMCLQCVSVGWIREAKLRAGSATPL